MPAVIGIFDVVGTTLSGRLSDRFDNRLLFIIFYGLDWVATVPPTVRLAADTFGKARVDVMFGWIFAEHQLGSATVAFGAGVLRT